MPRKRRKPSQVLGDQLPALRRIAGLTQEQLADRLRRIGSALDATAIAKIETTTSKRRGVSLDEALEIAAALGVSPMHLFFPREAGATVPIAPKLKEDVPLLRAHAWLAGQQPLPGYDSEPEWLIFESAVSEDEMAVLGSMRHVSQEELEEEDLERAVKALRQGWRKTARQRTATRHRAPKEGGKR